MAELAGTWPVYAGVYRAPVDDQGRDEATSDLQKEVQAVRAAAAADRLASAEEREKYAELVEADGALDDATKERLLHEISVAAEERDRKAQERDEASVDREKATETANEVQREQMRNLADRQRTRLNPEN